MLRRSAKDNLDGKKTARIRVCWPADEELAEGMREQRLIYLRIRPWRRVERSNRDVNARCIATDVCS
jgi:hypothetical protein